MYVYTYVFSLHKQRTLLWSWEKSTPSGGGQHTTRHSSPQLIACRSRKSMTSGPLCCPLRFPPAQLQRKRQPVGHRSPHPLARSPAWAQFARIDNVFHQGRPPAWAQLACAASYRYPQAPLGTSLLGARRCACLHGLGLLPRCKATFFPWRTSLPTTKLST